MITEARTYAEQISDYVKENKLELNKKYSPENEYQSLKMDRSFCPVELKGMMKHLNNDQEKFVEHLVSMIRKEALKQKLELISFTDFDAEWSERYQELRTTINFLVKPI